METRSCLKRSNDVNSGDFSPGLRRLTRLMHLSDANAPVTAACLRRAALWSRRFTRGSLLAS